MPTSTRLHYRTRFRRGECSIGPRGRRGYAHVPTSGTPMGEAPCVRQYGRFRGVLGRYRVPVTAARRRPRGAMLHSPRMEGEAVGGRAPRPNTHRLAGRGQTLPESLRGRRRPRGPVLLSPRGGGKIGGKMGIVGETRGNHLAEANVISLSHPAATPTP